MVKRRRGAAIPLEVRGKVLAYREQGDSFGSIAIKCKISKSQAYEIWEKYQETKSVKDRPRSGAPRNRSRKLLNLMY